jgi:hypothetical protein
MCLYVCLPVCLSAIAAILGITDILAIVVILAIAAILAIAIVLAIAAILQRLLKNHSSPVQHY